MGYNLRMKVTVDLTVGLLACLFSCFRVGLFVDRDGFSGKANVMEYCEWYFGCKT